MKSVKRVKWTSGWKRIEDVCSRDNRMVEIGYDPSADMPYCVQFAGNGHYFKTITEARAYCHGRGWLAHSGIYKEGQ